MGEDIKQHKPYLVAERPKTKILQQAIQMSKQVKINFCKNKQ